MIEKNRPPTGEDDDLRVALAGLDPKARDAFRRVLIQTKPTVTRSPLSCSATATSEAATGPTSSTC